MATQKSRSNQKVTCNFPVGLKTRRKEFCWRGEQVGKFFWTPGYSESLLLHNIYIYHLLQDLLGRSRWKSTVQNWGAEIFSASAWLHGTSCGPVNPHTAVQAAQFHFAAPAMLGNKNAKRIPILKSESTIIWLIRRMGNTIFFAWHGSMLFLIKQSLWITDFWLGSWGKGHIASLIKQEAVKQNSYY